MFAGRLSPPRQPTVSGGTRPPSAPSVLAWGRKIVLNNSKQQQRQVHRPQNQPNQQPLDGSSQKQLQPLAPWSTADPVLAGAAAAAASVGQPEQAGQSGSPLSSAPDKQMSSQNPQDMTQALQVLQQRLGSGEAVPHLPGSDLVVENEKLRKMLETVVRDLHETEAELKTTRREFRATKQHCSDLEDEKATLKSAVSELSEMKKRLTKDLNVAAERLQSYTENRESMAEKVESMERDELLAGTVVVRLSEHITAVEEVTVQSRKSIELLVKDLQLLVQDIAKAQGLLQGDVKSAEDPLPPLPNSEAVEDQYRLLRQMVDTALATVSLVNKKWGTYRESTSDLGETLMVQTDALSRVQVSIIEAQTKLTELAKDKSDLEQLLEDKTQLLAEANTRLNATATLVAETDSRISALVRDGEQEVTSLQLKIESLQSEVADLRKKSSEAHVEIKRLTEARERAEANLEREIQEQKKLSDQLSENLAAKDDKDGVVLSLEKDVRQLRSNEERLTMELNKLHGLRAEKELIANTLSDQNKELQNGMDILQHESTELQREVAEEQATVRQKERELAAKERALVEAKAQIESLHEELEGQKNLLESLQNEVKRVAEAEKRAVKEASYFRSILLNKDPARVEKIQQLVKHSETDANAPLEVANTFPTSGSRCPASQVSLSLPQQPSDSNAIPHPEPSGNSEHLNSHNTLSGTAPSNPTISVSLPLPQPLASAPYRPTNDGIPLPLSPKAAPLNHLQRSQVPIQDVSLTSSGISAIAPAQGYAPHNEDSIVADARTISPPRVMPTRRQHWSPLKEHPQQQQQQKMCSVQEPMSPGSSYQQRLHGVAERLRTMLKTENHEASAHLLPQDSIPATGSWRQWPQHP